jgi:hypothetical protein
LFAYTDSTLLLVHPKIDLPAAHPEQVAEQMQAMFDINPAEILQVSAKSGRGVDALLEAIVERIPPPKGDLRGPLKALLFDSSWVISLDSVKAMCPYAQTRLIGTTVTAESYRWLRLNRGSCGEVRFDLVELF